MASAAAERLFMTPDGALVLDFIRRAWDADRPTFQPETEREMCPHRMIYKIAHRDAYYRLKDLAGMAEAWRHRKEMDDAGGMERKPRPGHSRKA